MKENKPNNINNNKTLSAEELFRLVDNEATTSNEAHLDEFEQAALEGLLLMKNKETSLEELNSRIDIAVQEKLDENKIVALPTSKKKIYYLTLAASLLLIAGLFFLYSSKKNETLMLADESISLKNLKNEAQPAPAKEVEEFKQQETINPSGFLASSPTIIDSVVLDIKKSDNKIENSLRLKKTTSFEFTQNNSQKVAALSNQDSFHKNTGNYENRAGIASNYSAAGNQMNTNTSQYWKSQGIDNENTKTISDTLLKKPYFKEEIVSNTIFSDISKREELSGYIASEYKTNAAKHKNEIKNFANKASEQKSEGKTILEFDKSTPDALHSDALASDDEMVPTYAEKMPEYPGGTSGLLDFLRKNMPYPEECVKDGPMGKIILNFIVNTDGSISSAKILKGYESCQKVKKEIEEKLYKMPLWTPGMNNAEPIRVKMTIPLIIDMK